METIIVKNYSPIFGKALRRLHPLSGLNIALGSSCCEVGTADRGNRYSKIRNYALANAFSYMRIIEQWGSGIPRIIEEVKAYGLGTPEFIDPEQDLRINIWRNAPDLSGTKNLHLGTEE